MREQLSPLKPFWRYYGGKYRAALRYPKPLHPTIIEPFAGAAGYSMRYPDRNVILVEKYPVVAEMWRYLIAVKPSEIRRIPSVESVDDLPAWVPAGGRSLVGFWMNFGTVAPRKVLSAAIKKKLSPTKAEGWTSKVIERIASQVGRIKHWKIFECSYSQCADIEATWYVDPPYNNKAGACYKHGPDGIDYQELGSWCQSRKGQVIVCENEGADWLPFEPFATFKASPMSPGKGSKEAIWTKGCSA